MFLKKTNKSVHCKGCANLFYLGADTKPMCVAGARFIEGPIRDKVEVVGIVPAEERNLLNNCPYRKRISREAYIVKRWLLWRLNDGNGGKRIKESEIDKYTIEEEYDRKRELIEDNDKENREREELFFEENYEHEEIIEEEEGEDIRDDGGAGSDDEPGPAGESGREDVQNS